VAASEDSGAREPRPDLRHRASRQARDPLADARGRSMMETLQAARPYLGTATDVLSIAVIFGAPVAPLPECKMQLPSVGSRTSHRQRPRGADLPSSLQGCRLPRALRRELLRRFDRLQRHAAQPEQVITTSPAGSRGLARAGGAAISSRHCGRSHRRRGCSGPKPSSTGTHHPHYRSECAETSGVEDRAR
jgi:hypothetical protein